MVRRTRDDWPQRDYYGILGVPVTASRDEINRAYRRRARATHPDVNAEDPSADKGFEELAAAREVLTDPTARAAYDELRNVRTEAGDEGDHAARRHTDMSSGPAPVVPPMPVLGQQRRRAPSGPTIRVGPVVWTPNEKGRP